jgi:predicted DNA-binding transcriptional regulator AlpA
MPECDCGERGPHVVIHISDDGDFTWHHHAFPIGERLLPASVTIRICPDCVARMHPHAHDIVGDLPSLKLHIVGQHNVAVDGAIKSVMDRGKLLSHAQVLERVPFGRTRLNELLNDGQFPAPLFYGSKRHWYERDVAEAVIKLATPANPGKRKAPLNRYIQRR